MNVIEIFDTENNKLKYQGKPMIRRVHLLKLRNKRLGKITYFFRNIPEPFVKLGEDIKELSSSFKEFIDAIERVREDALKGV